MHRSQIRRINITDLNPHLICLLCGGYYIDATTIIECLHSFCKSCIVRYLETNKYCPICDVQVHKTKPLQNIRPDNTLQDIVYKLVPGLFQNEMCRRKEFYSNHPDAKPANPEDSGEVTEHSHIYSSDESINIALEYSNYGDVGESAIPKRYLRCPVGVTVSHIQKLIRAKFGLSSTHRVDILYRGEILDDDFTLLDIAYIYRWRRKELISLSFHIFESSVKRIKIDYNLLNKEAGLNCQVNTKLSIADDAAKSFQTSKCTATEPHNTVDTSSSVSLQKSPDHNSSNKTEIRKWKEVQIQISENGVMSVTGITSENNTELPLTNSVAAVKPEVNFSLDSAQDSSVTSESCSVIKDLNRNNSIHPDAKNRKISDIIVDPITKQSKLNTSKTFEPSGCQGNKVGNRQEANSRISNTCFSSSTLVQHPPSADVKLLRPQELTKSMIGKIDNYPTKECTTREAPKMAIVAPTKSVGSPMVAKKHSNSPIGYKTLKTPPKSWNPSISRASFLPSKSHLYSQSSPKKEQSSHFCETNLSEIPGNKVPPLSKPPRFFKARNTPRYLGNPASGVKPIFQVSPTESVHNAPVKQESLSAALGSPKLGNTKIMKIDPKTLGPVVSSSLRAPTPPTLPVISTSAVLKREFPLHGNPARELPSANKITSSNISLNTGLTTTRTASSSLNTNSIIPNLPSTAAHQLYGNLPAFPGVSHPPPLIRSVSPHLTSAYHPLNMIYNPHQHNRIHSQVTNTLATPAVQRIPATNSQQKTFSTNNNSITLNNNIIQPKVSSSHMCHYSTSKQSSEISPKLPIVDSCSDISVNGERRKCELNLNSNTEPLDLNEPSADSEIKRESTSLTGSEKIQESKEVEKNKLCDLSSGHNVSVNCDQNFPVCIKGAVRQNLKKKENFHVENFTLEKKNR